MSPRIRVLPDQIRNLIAAGEVVDRPASVIKELLENSIDAGATSIDITIEGGGRTLLAVADDGEGMSRDDALRSLERHATSKLRTAEDLGSIGTLGFRGEALPAISSVSDLTLITRVRESDAATATRVRYGKREEPIDAPRAAGTTVEVRSLFARTPARSRFLKSNATEVRWITQVVTAYAMGYPAIAFSYSVNGRRHGRYLAAADSAERIRDVLGGGIHWASLELSGEPSGLAAGIQGLISEPDVGRSSAGHIYFFVNRRWIASRPLMQTLLRAYSPFLPQRRYPAAVIYLEMPPESVDVNVHPTKREVRFRESGKVCNDLFRAVENRLRDLRRGRFPAGGGVAETRSSYPIRISPASPGVPQQVEGIPPEMLARMVRPAEEVAEEVGPGAFEKGDGSPGPRLIATLAETYLLAVDGDDLVLIDQHAAHERILYEQAQRALEGSPPARQALLLPLTLELTPQEAQALEEYRDDLEKLGFEIGPFGGRSVLVEATPADLKRWENGQVLMDILDEMGQASSVPDDRVSHVAASFACHTAVRAGDSLNPQEQTALLSRLFACKDWHRCPHGRPTVVRVDRAEIERRFRRPSPSKR
ncbi:MAG: DNA mismatch repair endonuclease MutL [Candidatus Eisenbacteria sp.]|nr:DNA mismatch repair endonuclease MutL [Candidatus Eisenbacteria bacterium]